MKHFRTYSRFLIPLLSALVGQPLWVATAWCQDLRGELSGAQGSRALKTSSQASGVSQVQVAAVSPVSPVSPVSSVPQVAANENTGSQTAVGAGTSVQTVTTISSKKGAYLDSKAYMATFNGSVSVVDARFSLTCDKLTAFFVRPSVESAGEVKAESGRSGLDKAEAEGDVIIIQDKVGDKGEVERSLARAQKAVYDSQTGNITLSGWPQVEQKQNVTMAAEESTVIILNRKGKLEVLGHSKSILRNASMNDGH